MKKLNPEQIRKDFPIFKRMIHGKPLAYLDSTATSQKPAVVIEAMDKFQREYNANVHRGIYVISEEATAAYEDAREKVRVLINAKSTKEIIFTRNATEAMNLVRYTWGRQNIKAGDEIVLTEMEHHSNLIPWQLLAKETGATTKFVPVNLETGMLEVDKYDSLITNKTKLVGVTHMSNVLGTINPVKMIADKAHRVGAKVLLDAAQSVPHLLVDVQDLACDFLAVSGHKMLAPSGIGFLYAKEELLEHMDPFLGGGDMIREVHLDRATWNDLPWKFEAGTPNVVGAIGLGAAIDYLMSLGMENVHALEMELTEYGLKALMNVPDLTIYGSKDVSKRGGVLSFTIKGVHPHDLASIVDEEGIAIRAGHMCAQPLMEKIGVRAVARASFYVYTIKEEIDRLVHALGKAKDIFAI